MKVVKKCILLLTDYTQIVFHLGGKMVFSSLTFLWIFLPLVLLINYLLSFIKNQKIKMLCKNINLLIASFIFYAWGGIKYVFIMLASILGNYFFALLIDKFKEKTIVKKTFFVLSIIFNLGLLFYFKYTNFFIDILESIAKANFGLKEVILPIGISFFTFQSMSYVIDVYMNKVDCQKNVIMVALYVSLFPQLIAGPIVKYSDVAEQLLTRQESVDLFVVGIKRFLYGLAKKVIISNVVGEVTEKIFQTQIADMGTSMAWLGIICYTIQIYYDFSGYSDMAIGLGKIFGFNFLENFNYPYMSTSVRDFWRRWHISLSSWFKEYVYIPLGGNRKGKIRTYINLFVVFLLTGLWHGANYTFLLWGIFYGVFLVIERLFLGKLLDKNKFKFINWLYTMFVVVLLWVFFRAENIDYAFKFIAKMFSFSKNNVSIAYSINLWQWIMLFIGMLFAGPMQAIFKKAYVKIKDKTWFFCVDYGFQIVLYVLVIFLLIGGSFNPFIYFQF